MTMTLPELPKDSVEEILCRVPATNLKRLGCTCKRWNRLFKDDRRFVREHCDKAAKEFLAFMLTKEHRICQMSVNLQGGDVEVKRELRLPDPYFNHQFDIFQVFHCNGLLLCTDNGVPRDGSKIVVWNPFTGQTRWIEAIGFRFVLGYSQDKKSCRKSYKVLNFTRGTNNSEIYDFDSDSWRLVHHDIAPGWTIDYSSCRSVSFKGSIYWIAKENVGQTRQRLVDQAISLLRFDFSTEKSQRLPLPYQRVCYSATSLSAVREDKLSALLRCDLSSKTEIWVTNKIDETTTKTVSWTKLLALDLSFDLPISDFGSFLFDEDKKVVVWLESLTDTKDYTTTMDKIYIVGEDNNLKVIDFGLVAYADAWPVIFNYVPSFVQIERAQIKRPGGKRKRAD